MLQNYEQVEIKRMVGFEFYLNLLLLRERKCLI